MTASTYNALTPEQLAHLGEGAVGYVRKIRSDELKARYPGLDDIAAGLELWALFSANGMPILLADERDSALAGAVQNDLQAVSIH